MNSEERPQGGMNGERLPQRLPGYQLRWFGTLPDPVSIPRERRTRSRRGDAAAFIAATRRLRAATSSPRPRNPSTLDYGTTHDG